MKTYQKIPKLMALYFKDLLEVNTDQSPNIVKFFIIIQNYYYFSLNQQ